jgi:cytochrome c biogenesis protein CcdA
MLNPGTIAPALVFAVSSRPVQRVLQFGSGFILVNFAGGVLLALGPGHLLVGLIPDIGHDLKHVLELVGGVALLIAAMLMVVFRQRLVRRDEAEAKTPRGGSAFVAGAGIALAELPTAFPYFAAIAAMEAAHLSVGEEILLLALFNVIFLAPVFMLALVLALFPEKRDSLIEPFRRWMSQHWPQVLAGILAAAGAALIVLVL